MCERWGCAGRDATARSESKAETTRLQKRVQIQLHRTRSSLRRFKAAESETPAEAALRLRPVCEEQSTRRARQKWRCCCAGGLENLTSQVQNHSDGSSQLAVSLYQALAWVRSIERKLRVPRRTWTAKEFVWKRPALWKGN